MALSIDEISALTQELVMPLIADNIFNSNPVFARLWAKGPKEQGGTAIRAPLMYAKVGASGAIRGFDTMQIDADDQFTAADFDWKEYYGAIVVSKREMLQNSGVPEQISHVSAKSQATEMSLRDTLGTGLYSDGTTNDKLIDGLDSICAITGTYPSGGGGINRADEAWWRAGFRTATEAVSFANIQSNVGSVTEQPNSPTMMVTAQFGFDEFIGLLETNQRHTDSSLASLGFETVLFRNIPLVVDSHVNEPTPGTNTNWFYLNENFLQLVSHKDENFDFVPFRQAFNQKVMVAYIFWTGNLVCNNPRFQGLVVATTAVV